MNGGTCTDEVRGFACTCSASWAGPVCATEVEQCAGIENDCDKTLGICRHVGVGTHECVCHAGYSSTDGGKTCANILECDSSPCLNGGTCTDGQCTSAACRRQWACTCVGNFQGDTCQLTRSPTLKACPAGTLSAAGAASLSQCTVVAGYYGVAGKAVLLCPTGTNPSLAGATTLSEYSARASYYNTGDVTVRRRAAVPRGHVSEPRGRDGLVWVSGPR